MVAIKATRGFVVPMFLEQWSKDEAAVSVLQNLRGVVRSLLKFLDCDLTVSLDLLRWTHEY